MSHPSSLLAVAQEPLLCLDDEARIVAVNQAGARRLGAPVPALLASSLLDLLHPEDRARVAAGLAAAPADGAVCELRCRLRGGPAVALRCARDTVGLRTVALGEAESAAALRAERDAARRQLSAVLDAMQDIVLLTDADGIITGLNRAPVGMTADQLLGVPMLKFAAPDEQAPMRQRYADVHANGELIAYETTAVYPDGSIERFSSRLGPIRAGDRTVGVVLITRNVTEEHRVAAARHRAEQQLQAHLLQLERSNRELERFASVASHDLQEPLRKIQAFCDRLRARFHADLPEAGRDYLERIRGAAARMQDLINDLLMFSRLSTVARAPVRVDLGRVARGVLSDLELRIEETGGRVEVGELPPIEADPLHMRQLFQNLIGNALKFVRPDVPPVVTIRGEVVPAASDREPARLRLLVADNGIGIEPRHYAKIFGIFERLHSRDRYEGTGVGLAVCRKIVEQHGGSITVASEMHAGTTFTILLPIERAPTDPAASATPA